MNNSSRSTEPYDWKEPKLIRLLLLLLPASTKGRESKFSLEPGDVEDVPSMEPRKWEIVGATEWGVERRGELVVDAAVVHW